MFVGVQAASSCMYFREDKAKFKKPGSYWFMDAPGVAKPAPEDMNTPENPNGTYLLDFRPCPENGHYHPEGTGGSGAGFCF